MQLEHHIGKHTVRIEGAVIFVRHVGDYHLSEAKQVTALISDFRGRLCSSYLLVDLKDMGDVQSDARKHVTAWFRDIKFEVVLLCGAGFTTRVVAKMVAAAAGVLTGGELPFVFVSSEKLGRALIAEHRRSALKPPPSTR